jgi:hypothetical protein
MKKLFLSLLLASPLMGQMPIPVTVANPSFEVATPTGNYDINVPFPGWTCKGLYYGRLNPTATQIPAIPDGKTVLWLQSTGCTQDLGIAAAPNTVYMLKFNVGSQSNFPVPAVYSANLLAGGVLIPGCTAGGDPPTVKGQLVQQRLTCTTGTVPPTGNLSLSLTSGPNQTIFDNIILTSASSVPPNFVTFQFPVQLFNCTKCDKSDDSTEQMGIFSGAVIGILQDGQNVCSGSINTNGQFSCSGPVNITPTFINLTISISDSTGKPIAPSFTNSVANILLAGRGIIPIIFRLDIANGVPRGLDIHTE